MDEHRDEIRRLPNLRLIIKSLSDFTKQANMKELCLKTIAELCYIKEGQKDQREMMREINDKDRASVEKYMTKIKEERPSPAPMREPITEPSSPARQLTRPSAGGGIGGGGGGTLTFNRTMVRTSVGGRGIPSPKGALQFSPRAPPQSQLDLNAVNNNDAPAIGGIADPCGTL